jgi:Zn-dependent protease with chaperone function
MDFYPPSPADVPRGLARPTARYRLLAFLVAAGLLTFVVIYLGLIVGFGLISIFSLSQLFDLRQFDSSSAAGGAIAIMLAAFVGITSGLVSLYFIKGLFKTPRRDESGLIEITRDQQPRLFAFIERVCADTGAPRPAKIVLSPEVNAGVYYACGFWSLFLPTRKNLHIGLGLVNCLNLVEFKAVIAHEFGHFSQRSMRLGAYVFTANRVIREIIYGRDWLDDSLKVFGPALKLIRWVLSVLFRALNVAHAQLSRQMEFQADLVAVSVTGSDAIVHGLLRSDFAQECYEHTVRDLIAASDHNIATQDFFLHQTKTADHLRVLKDEPQRGVPPARTENEAAPVFPPNETVLPPMWASHPPHYLRERNCKRVSVKGPADDRPAWVLFDDVDALRRRVTESFYQKARPGVALSVKTAETIQRFVDDDRAETIYVARYHGMYADGLIAPGAIDSLERKVPQRYEQPSRLLDEHADIFRPELKEMLACYRARRDDKERLLRFAQKVEKPRGGRFEFRGKMHRVRDAVDLLETLSAELKNDHEELAALDRRIFLVYMGMARQLSTVSANDLEHRYRFHLEIQTMIATLRHWDNEVQSAFQGIAGKRDPDAGAIRNVAHALDMCMNALDDQAAAASRLKMPAFRNMKAGQPLSFFLEPKPIIRGIIGTEQIVNGAWINQALQRNAEMIDKLRRILFKSLGSLLTTQEKIGESWKAKYTAEAANPVRRSQFAIARQ